MIQAARRNHTLTRELPRFLLVLPVLAGIALCSCSPTRDSVGPPDTPPIPWRSPTDPAIVLENIRVTFDAKSIDNYDRSLADEFTFVPNGIDHETGGACFDGWNRDREIAVMGNILRTPGTIAFTWNAPGEPQTVPDDPEDRYYRLVGYRMIFGPPADTVLAGRADLYLREVRGLWVLYKWVDTGSAGDTLTLGRARCAGGVQAR